MGTEFSSPWDSLLQKMRPARYWFCTAVLFLLFQAGNISYAQVAPDTTASANSLQTDSVEQQKAEKKSGRKAKRDISREELRRTHSRFFLEGSVVYAFLDTKLDFNVPGSMIHAVISLENNLHLPDKRPFFSGSLLWRFTPSSGLYINYYGLNRSESYSTRHDIPWQGDTIPAGTNYDLYFNTHVFSLGYVFSILKDPHAFLGAYFNVYVMLVKTGLRGENLILTNPSLNTTLPLPNLGVLMKFDLTSWLAVSGNAGVFSLYTPSLGGYVQDYKISFSFRVISWLSLSISYERFSVHAIFPRTDINTVVDYDFHGPSAGIVIKF